MTLAKEICGCKQYCVLPREQHWLSSNTAEVGRATDPRSIKAALWSPKSTANIRAHISSIPAAADIQVDGAYVGATPSDIDLACCWHDVTIIKPGRKLWTRRARITGGVLKVTAHLQKCARNSRLQNGNCNARFTPMEFPMRSCMKNSARTSPEPQIRTQLHARYAVH